MILIYLHYPIEKPLPMTTAFEFPFVIILIFLFAVNILLKYFYFIRLRSTRSTKRFFKSFFRWYNSNERDMAYDQPSKKRFMLLSNLLNIPFWIILIILIKLLLGYLNTTFLSSDN